MAYVKDEILTLWFTYLGEARLNEWNYNGVFDDPNAKRLVRIAEAEYKLIYPGEGVHFEGDG